MNQQNKFDGILMTIIQQKGNIDGFFDSVFGFLRRHTDFFFNQKKAEQIIVNTCKTNFQKFQTQQKIKQKQEQKKKQEAEKKKKQKQQKDKLQAQLKKKQQQQAVQLKKPVAQKQVQQAPKQAQKTQQKKQDDEPAPKGNGGKTDQYIWTQTLQNLEMFIFVDASVTKKLTNLTITCQKLQVKVKGQTIIQGKWKEKINSEQTYWTIQDSQLDGYKGKYIHINIQKWKNQNSWWSTPIQGHPEINTQKINPEPSKLSDLDGQTKSTVEKMMFDMRQKQQGLPSSDQLQKQDKLKQFMKMHPQMDFSQCKFG